MVGLKLISLPVVTLGSLPFASVTLLPCGPKSFQVLPDTPSSALNHNDKLVLMPPGPGFITWSPQ